MATKHSKSLKAKSPRRAAKPANSTADVIATLKHVNAKLDPVAKLAEEAAGGRRLTVDTSELWLGLGELKSLIGTMRYLVMQARPEDEEADVFYCLANAADAIHTKLDNACRYGTDKAPEAAS